MLRECAATLRDAAGTDVCHERADDPADVDAMMLVEALVLDSEHGLNEVLGYLAKRHRNAFLHRSVDGADRDR